MERLPLASGKFQRFKQGAEHQIFKTVLALHETKASPPLHKGRLDGNSLAVNSAMALASFIIAPLDIPIWFGEGRPVKGYRWVRKDR